MRYRHRYRIGGRPQCNQNLCITASYCFSCHFHHFHRDQQCWMNNITKPKKEKSMKNILFCLLLPKPFASLYSNHLSRLLNWDAWKLQSLCVGTAVLRMMIQLEQAKTKGNQSLHNFFVLFIFFYKFFCFLWCCWCSSWCRCYCVNTFVVVCTSIRLLTLKPNFTLP